MEKSFEGRIWKLGDDIDTDIIMPTQWVTLDTMDEVKKHAFEPLRPELAAAIQPGDIIVAGNNFGCGSSREHAPVAIKAAGVSCVIAKSFARIFYRNSINMGLPILECPEAVDAISNGDVVSVDADTGTIVDETTGAIFHAHPFPPFIQEIINAGGLVERTKQKIAESQAE